MLAILPSLYDSHERPFTLNPYTFGILSKITTSLRKLSFFHIISDCASKVSLSLYFTYVFIVFIWVFIISDVLFSNEVSFNVSIGFWSLNELFQKIQR